MAEPEAEAISSGPTPDPPQNASDVARKVENDARDQPLPDKAKVAASELDREVSGEYEAKQERDAATDPTTTPTRHRED
jgi:hypothetical protein